MSAPRTCTAIFEDEPPVLHALTVNRNGTGSGRVTSSPGGIDCGANCVANFQQGTGVTLTAMPNSGSVHTGWSGNCPDSGTQTTFTMSSPRTCTATFDIEPGSRFTLRVRPNGTGSGRTTSTPSGIDCLPNCDVDFDAGAVVTLNAVANPGSTFTGWADDCGGLSETSTINLTMNREIVCAVLFRVDSGSSPSLTVSRAGDGSGTITATNADINCGSDCSDQTVSEGSTVSLRAVAHFGSIFRSWSGNCSGTNPETTVAIEGTTQCTARFEQAPFWSDFEDGTVCKWDAAIGGSCP